MIFNTRRVGVFCVFSSHAFWTSSSLDVPAGVTQEEDHTGFLIHLPSAARALIFLARRIQSFLSLVDREVEFLCTNDLIVPHPLGIFFCFFNEKNPVCRDRSHVPTCQKVTRLPLSYRATVVQYKYTAVITTSNQQQYSQESQTHILKCDHIML